MATATRSTRTTERTVTEEVTTYTLELSEEEADAFRRDYARLFGERYEGLTLIRQALSDAVVPTPAPLAVGDRIRILEDRLDSAVVKAGEVFEVSYVRGTSFSVWEDPSKRLSEWHFNQSHEGTGYERVTDPGPTRVRDSDDDVWVKQLNGTWDYTGHGDVQDYRGWSWEALNLHYGPLTPLES